MQSLKSEFKMRDASYAAFALQMHRQRLIPSEIFMTGFYYKL